MAKLFANSGDPDQTLILRRLIWVCTVCQLPFYGSPNYNGLKTLSDLHVFAVWMEKPWLSLECPVMTLFRLQMCRMMSLGWLTGFLTSGLQCFLLAAIRRMLIVKVICFQSGISSLTESHAGVRLMEGACCKRYVHIIDRTL